MTQVSITIDASDDQLAQILAVLGGSTSAPAPAPAKAAPAKKAAAPAKKAAAPKPAPEPEPEEDEEPEETTAAPTKEDALARAGEVMDVHGTEVVKAALEAAGAPKVGQLKPNQIQKFMDALEAGVAELADGDDSPL